MSLFKEEKQSQKEQEALEKYGLQTLANSTDIDSVKKIIKELNRVGLTELTVALGGGNERDFLKNQMHCQRAIIEQNFIMIRQLDRIATLLESNKK